MSFQSDHPDQERKHHQFLKTHSPYPILITTAPKVTITLTSNTIDQFHFNFQSLFVSVSSFPSSPLCPLSFREWRLFQLLLVRLCLSISSSSIKPLPQQKVSVCVVFSFLSRAGESFSPLLATDGSSRHLTEHFGPLKPHKPEF